MTADAVEVISVINLGTHRVVRNMMSRMISATEAAIAEMMSICFLENLAILSSLSGKKLVLLLHLDPAHRSFREPPARKFDIAELGTRIPVKDRSPIVRLSVRVGLIDVDSHSSTAIGAGIIA